MEKESYYKMSIFEKDNWWFVGRRKIIATLLEKFLKHKVNKSLDVGCGTGFNARVLSNFSNNVIGLEPSDIAISLIKQRDSNITVVKGDFPDWETKEHFDLITLFDVLEHIKDDKSAIKKIEELLNPGGIALITVPALPLLWSQHDLAHHHYRRYTIKTLKKIISYQTNLKIKKISYFNFFLFLPILFFRLIKNILPSQKNKSNLFPLPYPINKFLTVFFSLESYILRYFNFPVGVSIICLLEKK